MRLHRHWPMLACLLCAGPAWAQQASPPASTKPNPPAQQGTIEQLPPVTVIEAPEKKPPKPKTAAKKSSTAASSSTGTNAQPSSPTTAGAPQAGPLAVETKAL